MKYSCFYCRKKILGKPTVLVNQNNPRIVVPGEEESQQPAIEIAYCSNRCYIDETYLRHRISLYTAAETIEAIRNDDRISSADIDLLVQDKERLLRLEQILEGSIKTYGISTDGITTILDNEFERQNSHIKLEPEERLRVIRNRKERQRKRREKKRSKGRGRK